MNDWQVGYGNEEASIINIIVPLAGRLNALRSFLDRFERNVLPVDDRVHLTVVFFGTSEWDQVRREMINFEKRTAFNHFHLLNINSTFSRARGLQVLLLLINSIKLSWILIGWFRWVLNIGKVLPKMCWYSSATSMCPSTSSFWVVVVDRLVSTIRFVDFIIIWHQVA